MCSNIIFTYFSGSTLYVYQQTEYNYGKSTTTVYRTVLTLW